MAKAEVVNYFLDKGYLLSPDFLNLQEEDFDTFFSLLDKTLVNKSRPTILNKDLYIVVKKGASGLDINWSEFEKAKALLEKGKNGKIYQTFLDILNYNISEDKKQEINNLLDEVKEPQNDISEEINKEETTSVLVLKSYKEESKKRDIQNFVSYFRNRYEAIKNMLKSRQELTGLVSINRLKNKTSRELVSIIGLIVDKNITKNKNIVLTLEDPTSSINVVVNKERVDLYELAKDIVLDEVIGISGVTGNNILFANNIIFPDVPITTELKKCASEIYAAFISDLHVGSNMFLPDRFERFLKWINGEVGSFIQKRIAKKTKYLFILGDLVDGIGIYPEQDKELVIKDISKQYEECIALLKRVPSDIKIIICPGNHDALRISEPQPPLKRKFVEDLYTMNNVTLVSNPAWINIHSSEDFPGFDVLMYHGYSFDYYMSNVESIRLNGGYDRADLMMKLLLQKRHLAPTHTSTLYIPDEEKDPLVIEGVPDFFITGHIHKASISTYKNVTLICGSCWQAKTIFQERVGHNPEPARVPIVNLQTRAVKMMRF